RERAVYRDSSRRSRDRRRETDRLGDAVQSQIPSYVMSCAARTAWFDAGRDKGRLGILRDIEEVRSLKMFGEIRSVSFHGSGIDCEADTTRLSLTAEANLSREFLKRSIVAACHLRSDKGNLGVVGRNQILLTSSSRR